MECKRQNKSRICRLCGSLPTLKMVTLQLEGKIIDK